MMNSYLTTRFHGVVLSAVLICTWTGCAKEQLVYEIQPGPYHGVETSLESIGHECPQWFRDAKFGIWAHWGPQSIPGQGDWYARLMYVSDGDRYEQFYFDNKDRWNVGHWKSNIGDWEKRKGESDYRYHCEHFGHPSVFGYKDLCNQWKAENFDAQKLMAAYKRAGAKYVALIGHHHDNFDLWNSKYHEWNSVRVGPHKDFVRMFGDAARDAGLYFGVTLHPARTDWFATSRLMSDKDGPLKDVPYDGAQTREDGKGKWWEGLDPQKLYGKPGSELRDYTAQEKYDYFLRVKDLIDNYKPDLLYFDEGRLPRQEAGANIAAHYFNSSIQWHGSNQAVLNLKTSRNFAVPDTERGVGDVMSPVPWQTDTCIGNWFYTNPGLRKFKDANHVIRILVDIVSKNGNLLLNIPMPGTGELDPRGLAVLEGVGQWMDVNSEAIYGTRPWTTFGESKAHISAGSGHHNEGKLKYSADDYRFTRKGEVIYAFAMGTPKEKPQIRALGKQSPFVTGSVRKVTLLGRGELPFEQTPDALTIDCPLDLKGGPVFCFKVEGLKTVNKTAIIDIYHAREPNLPKPGQAAYTFDTLQYGDLSGQDGFATASTETFARIIPVDAARKNKRLIIDHAGTIVNPNFKIPTFSGKETAASITFDINKQLYSLASLQLIGDRSASPIFGLLSGDVVFKESDKAEEQIGRFNSLDCRRSWVRIKMVMNFQENTATLYGMNLSTHDSEFTPVEGLQNIRMGRRKNAGQPADWNTLKINIEKRASSEREIMIDNIEVLSNDNDFPVSNES